MVVGACRSGRRIYPEFRYGLAAKNAKRRPPRSRLFATKADLEAGAPHTNSQNKSVTCHGTGKRVVEAKAFSAFNRDGWGEVGTDEVPMPRMWQCMAQMACTGAEYADIPITFVNEKVLAQFLTTGTVPIDIYTIKRDESLIEFMINEAKVVFDCINTKTLPVPVNVGDAEMIWRRGNLDKFADATPEMLEAHILLTGARAALKLAEENKAIIEARIKNHMQDASELRYLGKTLATWRNNKDGLSFDKDAFAAAHPDLLAKFSKPKNGARVFLFKGD